MRGWCGEGGERVWGKVESKSGGWGWRKKQVGGWEGVERGQGA